MLIRKSERTRWYMGLQRLFDFPRTSFAPVSLRLRMARSKALNDEVVPGDPNHGSSLHSLSTIRPYITEMLPPPITKFLDAGSLTGRFAAGSHGRAVGSHGRNAWHDLSASKQLDSVAGGHQVSRIQRQRLQRQIPSGRAPFRSVVSSGLRPSGSSASLRIARDQRLATGSRSAYGVSFLGSPDLQQSFAPAASLLSSEHESGFDDLTAIADNSRRPSQQRQLMDSSIDLADERADTEEQSAGRSRTGVSTLHIDGGSLGRWTLQHLERSLGKPTSGMTGIDPRATLPRSRVSPF